MKKYTAIVRTWMPAGGVGYQIVFCRAKNSGRASAKCLNYYRVLRGHRLNCVLSLFSGWKRNLASKTQKANGYVFFTKTTTI